jgi:hypothetical protein
MIQYHSGASLGDLEDRAKALAGLFDEQQDQILLIEGNVFQADGREWLVLTDVEADEMAEDEVKSLIWAVKPDFICKHSSALEAAGKDALDCLADVQAKLCEDAQPVVKALIDDLDAFIADAVHTDGRGHFLAGYDGEERVYTDDDGEDWFIYAVN